MPSAAPPEPSTAWSPPPPVLTLCAHEVHVWRAELDGGGETDVERLATTLAPDERARAASFVFPPDRRRFTLGRVALRSVLARYLDVEPGAHATGRRRRRPGTLDAARPRRRPRLRGGAGDRWTHRAGARLAVGARPQLSLKPSRTSPARIARMILSRSRGASTSTQARPK